MPDVESLRAELDRMDRDALASVGLDPGLIELAGPARHEKTTHIPFTSGAKDILKGALPVWLGYRYFGPDIAVIAGLGAVLGHCFPVWLGFKGGKGVATYLGVLLAMAWPVAIAFGAIWLATAALTRYSSLAALAASAGTPLALWVLGYRPEAALFALLTALLWIMHRANIARLINGTEGKIGKPVSSGA